MDLSAGAIAAAVGCAAAYSAADFLRKTAPAATPASLVLLVFLILHIPVLTAWIFVEGDARLEQGYWLPGIVDAAVGLAANLLFVVALRRSPISLMVPLLALVPAGTLLAGGIVIGEWPTSLQSAGIILVAAGLLAVYNPARGIGPGAALHQLTNEPGAGPMAAVIVLWSLTPALDKLCLGRASVGVHGFVQVVMLAAFLAALMVAKDGLRALAVPRAAAPALIAAGVAGGVGYGLQLVAYQLTLVAVVELIKRVVSMASAMTLGGLVLREPMGGAKLLGFAIIALGLWLILVV